MAKRSPKEAALNKAVASLVEQFGTCVVIVSDSDATAEGGPEFDLIVRYGGHPSHGRGLLNDAWDAAFDSPGDGKQDE